MIEIRIHGRGGQGAVIASEVLAMAAFREGKHVTSFPAFGVERRGAPVAAFTRLDDRPIRLKCEIYAPDHVMVLDPSLLQVVDVTAGLKPGGWILVNSTQPPQELNFPHQYNVATVDANAIAIEHRLGPRQAPIVNTAILGACAKVTGIVSLAAVLEAVAEAVPTKKEDNVAAAREAYEKVQAMPRYSQLM
jgi:2-oxoacid:acceptor oxidoreductase gamma subunit (pyruvate/2-ketoisovalerate family)